MNFNIIQSLLMGFVSGLAELLPISAEGHRSLLRLCFGVESEGALFLLLTHIASLTVVLVGCKGDIARLRRARRLMQTSARRRRQQPDLTSVSTIRHLQNAAVIVVLGRLLSRSLTFMGEKMYLLSAAALVNGVLLWLPNVFRSGNKDSRNMAKIDGFLMGLGAGASAVPGISPVGAAVSAGVARGVERKFALRFAYLLLIPALAVSICFDLLAIIAGGVSLSAMSLVAAVAGAACAALGSWIGLRLMQALSRGKGYTLFSYYSWGFALLCFVLFLFL